MAEGDGAFISPIDSGALRCGQVSRTHTAWSGLGLGLGSGLGLGLGLGEGLGVGLGVGLGLALTLPPISYAVPLSSHHGRGQRARPITWWRRRRRRPAAPRTRQHTCQPACCASGTVCLRRAQVERGREAAHHVLLKEASGSRLWCVAAAEGAELRGDGPFAHGSQHTRMGMCGVHYKCAALA